MRRLFLSITALGLSCMMPLAARSASVTHDWTGTGPNGNMSIDVDDHGGSFSNGGNDESYNLSIDGTDVTATLTFYLFNGSAVDDGADDQDDGSNAANTGEDFLNGSGLTILEPPSVLTPPITEIGALSDNPLTPFSFQGRQTGLDVEQLTYVQNDKNFVIYEYKVTNNTGATVPVKIALGGDFDIGDTNSNDQDGKDLSVPMVFMHDTAANGNSQFYAPGLAVAGGTFDQYRLGSCCDTTYVNTDFAASDINRLHFFNARPNEECDDNNNVNGDGCSANCKVETGAESCGNGVVEAGEGCDDGNTTGGDGCDGNCRSENCGNNALDAGEECDDGDTTDGDGCSAFCTYEFVDIGHYCGDGTPNDGGVGDQQTNVEDNEVTISINLGTLNNGTSAVGAFCIVGGFSSVDGASAAANAVATANECITLYQSTIAVCGNSIQNAGEECDDGNTADNDGCDSNCTITGCGNGIQNPGEECDDGNNQDGDGCSANCQLESTCGDGVVDPGEACDDGNQNNNDLCSNLCTSNNFLFQGSGCRLGALPAADASAWLGLGSLLGAGWLLKRRRR
ncbi:MAG: hypothetical protein U1F66_11800 [bacterium]